MDSPNVFLVNINSPASAGSRYILCLNNAFSVRTNSDMASPHEGAPLTMIWSSPPGNDDVPARIVRSGV